MLKNAFAYVTRKSLKSLIILLVILSMSTLSLISLSIKDATNKASEETFGNITNSFTMEINRRVNQGTPRGGGNVRGQDIKKIVDVVTCREAKEKFSRVVSRDEIRRNDYNLNIPRYVDSSEKAESWDIYASMFGGLPISEINELKEYWTAFPTLKTALLEKTSGEYSKIVATDIKKAEIALCFLETIIKINVWSIVDDDVLCVNQLFYVQRDVRHE